MTVAGLQGGSAMHATVVPGQRTYEDAATAWSLRGTRPGRGGSRASCRPRSSPRPGSPCPGASTGTKVGPAAPCTDGSDPCLPVPLLSWRAHSPSTRDPILGTGAQEQEPHLLLATLDAAGRYSRRASSQSTRHAPGTSAPTPKTTPAPSSTMRHSAAYSQRLAHLRRRPKVMMRPHHRTRTAASSSGNTAPSVTCESVLHTLRQSSTELEHALRHARRQSTDANCRQNSVTSRQGMGENFRAERRMVRLPVLTELRAIDYGFFPGDPHGSGITWEFRPGLSLIAGINRNLSTTLRHWRQQFTEQFLLLWLSRVG